jgi:endoglucanase
VDIIAAFTAQEEVGLRGAKVVAQRTAPDVAIVLEGSPCHDLPDPTADPDDETEANPSARLGDGPVITVMDRSMVTDPRLVDFLQKTARKNDIPTQIKMQLGGGTDAGAIHIANAGTPAAVVSVPCRYIHSPVSILRRSDYNYVLRLVQVALHDLTFKTLERKD